MQEAAAAGRIRFGCALSSASRCGGCGGRFRFARRRVLERSARRRPGSAARARSVSRPDRRTGRAADRCGDQGRPAAGAPAGDRARGQANAALARAARPAAPRQAHPAPRALRARRLPYSSSCSRSKASTTVRWTDTSASGRTRLSSGTSAASTSTADGVVGPRTLVGARAARTKCRCVPSGGDEPYVPDVRRAPGRFADRDRSPFPRLARVSSLARIISIRRTCC